MYLQFLLLLFNFFYMYIFILNIILQTGMLLVFYRSSIVDEKQESTGKNLIFSLPVVKCLNLLKCTMIPELLTTLIIWIFTQGYHKHIVVLHVFFCMIV